MPKTVADLNKHKFISFGKGAPSPVYNPDWALKLGMHDGKKRKSIMRVNSVMGLLLAVGVWRWFSSITRIFSK